MAGWGLARRQDSVTTPPVTDWIGVSTRWRRGPAASGVLLLAMLIPLLVSRPAAAQAPEADKPVSLPPVVVIGETPVPALGTPIEKYAGNVQTIPAERIDNQNLLDISDTLYRNFGSVNINGSQGNPWQNDLTYRGFLASPLAGSPIGLSMYVDGMRFNDGFGETINWDLIPQSAIANIDVIPGSNPIFGLNTLGAALWLPTRLGFAYPGAKLEAWGGSFGRWAVNGEYGGSYGPFDAYLTFNILDDDGWRAHSSSELRQFFGKLGYRTSQTDVTVSFAYANNNLTGNGLAPESLIAQDRRAVYTFPDHTRNLMDLVNITGSRWLTDDLLVSGNTFYRYYKRTTSHGDVETSCVDEASDAVAFTPSGQLVPLGLCQGPAAGFVDASGSPLAGGLELESEGEFRKTRMVTQDWGV